MRHRAYRYQMGKRFRVHSMGIGGVMGSGESTRPGEPIDHGHSMGSSSGDGESMDLGHSMGVPMGSGESLGPGEPSRRRAFAGGDPIGSGASMGLSPHTVSPPDASERKLSCVLMTHAECVGF